MLTQRPLLTAGALLGIGLGGFFDGILLHQILQWHNLLSSKVPPIDLVSMKYNMVFDGLFHAMTWAVTLAGVVALFQAARRRDVELVWRVFVGSQLFGWGVFNFVEGLIDHQILGLHHVHPGSNQLAWDLAFLASGILLMILGGALCRAQAKGRDAPSSA